MEWFYFGCGSGAGHYLFSSKRGKQWGRRGELSGALSHMDGVLPPYPESGDILYQASFSVLGGIGVCALSWWDRSVDSRGASNSTVFAPGLHWTAETMLAEAPEHFPWVFARLPKPLTLHRQSTQLAA